MYYVLDVKSVYVSCIMLSVHLCYVLFVGYIFESSFLLANIINSSSQSSDGVCDIVFCFVVNKPAVTHVIISQ